MNVKTGEVLAMASYPDYDPSKFVGGISTKDWNEYNNNPNHPLVNKAMQVSYAPGSTFKMVTAIAALESNVVSIDERINDTGVYKLGNRTWNCWYYTDYHVGHGRLNVSDAIKHSCNYYFYEVGNRMGIDNLVKFAKYFGLGSKTGIELPSETKGVLASKEVKQARGETWVSGDTLNASIGQGDNEFSPLQMAKYISTLANGGNKVDVSIIKTIINADGTEVPKSEINGFVNSKLGLTDEQDDGTTIKKEYLDAVNEAINKIWISKENIEKEKIDLMWYLWISPNSPFFGKDKMATFESYFVKDKEMSKETKNPYYTLTNKEEICDKILKEFGLDEKESHIVNGHMPVKAKDGESPIRGNGKLLVIDGGFAKSYQQKTGNAGYILTYNSNGLLLSQNKPFESVEKAIEEERDIISEIIVKKTGITRKTVNDTDIGKKLRAEIADLEELLKYYENGEIK